MTEFDLQNELIEHFKTLNDFSGINFITSENVSYPNKRFSKPSNKIWYEVHFMQNQPFDFGVCENKLTRCLGIMQIDICTPLQQGEDEQANKYEWISKLFSRGTEIGKYIIIDKEYISSQRADVDHYRTSISIEWEADIEKGV